MKLFFKQMPKVSAFYLEKQKSVIPKNNTSYAVANAISKQKVLFTNPIFSNAFDFLPFSMLMKPRPFGGNSHFAVFSM